MPDPQTRALDLIFGRWRSQILHAGVSLGIFDALADGPKGAPAIAEQLNLDPALAYRLLRALGSLELLQEDGDRRFSLTDAGDLFRKDHPQTLRGVTLLEEGPEHYALWKHLPAMIRDGRQNAFMREFGRMAFDHAAREPAYAEVFNAAMSSYSSTQSAWVLEALDAYDFSSITHICDVGGGHGHTLCSLLGKYPHLSGTVLELPGAIENETLLWADKLNAGDRCKYVVGDMFASVPAADAYILKLVIHDWNDAECTQVLRTISESVSPGGRAFIIEHVVPGHDTPHFAKLFDIHMMCWGAGRERTVEEYAALLESAGWSYARTWFPASRMIGIVEGVRA